MRVLLTHAYSATNAGDGLLVDEAVDLVHEALGDAEITVVALDPASFPQMHGVNFVPLLNGSRRSIVAALLQDMPWQEDRPSFDIVIAVGGGYLRGGRLLESVKTALVHRPQLPKSPVPHVYLPQSIGPFRYGQRGGYARHLAHAAKVFVRDDKSLGEMSSIDPVRAPDMAILRMAKGLDPRSRTALMGDSRIGLVGRQLPGGSRRTRSYESGIAEMARSLEAELLVQAEARGNDDRDFYERRWGPGPYRRMLDATQLNAPQRPSVVISVRLHGALQALINGVPAVHLSYERKGWGAFGDLGISEFVHNAYDFDTELVARQARELRDDPARYWEKIDESVQKVLLAREALVSDIRELSRQS